MSRKAEPYDIYNEIDFKVQYMKTCDSFARVVCAFAGYAGIMSYY